MSIFRAYDIRGVYGKDLTDDMMLKIGKSLGTLVKSGKICVGYDSRASSKKLSEVLIKGLSSAGCEVISLGFVSNPMLYFYSWKNKIFGALVTASHNPKEWNGLKMVRQNGVSFIEEIKELETIYNAENFTEGKGKVKKAAVAKAYGSFLKKSIGTTKKKVVLECFGGAGTASIDVLKSLGLRVKSLHGMPNKNFYGFERPEPKGQNLDSLKKMILKEKADFGVAFDGDGDRSVFVDDMGRESNVSSIIAIFADFILSKKSGSILLTADCASEIEDIVKRHGGRTIWWRVGHGFIEDKSVKENVLFAAEQSSHMYFNEFYPFSDGAMATAYMSKLLTETKSKLSDLVDKMNINPIGKFYIDVGTDERKNQLMENLRRRYPNALDIMDGIKIKLNATEWILIRVSQTNPEINLCIEAESEKRIEEIAKEYTKMIIY
jgi:phosphomannomutase / phosphoglucomutase